ncbi:hypothetical protein OIDMADRAFT_52917 [Oidiodendron maius Zn]|uniref:Uncharacterized protein n=1 Tax=Oidiodendron maius (strain Zn) TaxID=913774 RepID=A0A0C3HLD3_OIDMZ|nr:hypothetical protein OIDMADRAFT_52917 [Oidiodendron maius Zn]
MSKRHGDNAFCGRTLRSAKKTRTSSSWALLPVEIRLMILEEISRQKYCGWAASCVEELESMVIRKAILFNTSA